MWVAYFLTSVFGNNQLYRIYQWDFESLAATWDGCSEKVLTISKKNFVLSWYN